MVMISKTFDFDAAHFLPHVPAHHKCRRLHGHTYRVEVQLRGDVHEGGPQQGMVVDYAAIALVWEPVHALLDHRLLNDVPGLENPTTEVLAPFILNIFATALAEVVAVRVYESATTWCEARRDPETP